MSISTFHPAIQRWFTDRFRAPTPPQELGWPVIQAGEHVLIAAPTGSGKTLTAFLAAINRLFSQAVQEELPDQIRVVYISPLRALSNDMQRNLQTPLEEISQVALAAGYGEVRVRVGLRTGDTPQKDRAALLRRPPHILVTTPESLYLLLTSPRGREKLRHVETVIVDEIHALVRDKRGSHLALTLERLRSVTEKPFQRIGLSATQRPIELIADFLVGYGNGVPATLAPTAEHSPQPDTSLNGCSNSPSSVSAAGCRIIDVGHQRELDLDIEIPTSELGAVCMHEQWAEVNTRICELINSHRSTLIFVNTRRMAERVTHQLTELLGPDAVSSHHGSLAAELRLDTEQRLKHGQLKAVVATASLELGLDIGYIDLVLQIGSPRSIAVFLQRVGRSGHALGLIPKGRLFALTRDELFECTALLRAIRHGRLDTIPIPEAPLDILAQQMVAEAACGECSTDELFSSFRAAYPYRNLARKDFDAVIQVLAEGINHASGKSRLYLHHDHVQRRIRARPGARISAVSGGGAIPEIASYRVVLQPEQTVVGSVDEEFGVESQAGDIFLLGNTSWRIESVRGGDVNVSDAHGAPPTIPFWRGESPGRTIELSEEVSLLRDDLAQRITDPDSALEWLIAESAIPRPAAEQLVAYAAAQFSATGILPTHKHVVFERFFDESGGMQMVIHAPFGGRITRAWGLAMRKRFCRSFDFELQATADDDGIVLSLGPQHSFPLESMFGMLTPQNVQHLLEQALLAVPTFQTRWRWNVTRALLVMRSNNGKKVPPPLQRFRADDLLTAVFPQATGCLENHHGDVELPDHPLVRQTMHDALHEAHDLDGLIRVLGEIQTGKISLHARDTREPSPFSYELLNANPYAFLDGGEAQERRARAVATRRSLTVESVHDLGRLDPEAIERVRHEAQPLVRNADEVHDVLMTRYWLPDTECADWQPWLHELAKQKRAVHAEFSSDAPTSGTRSGWVAAERWPAIQAAFTGIVPEYPVVVPDSVRSDWTAEDARTAIVRGWIEVSGPTTPANIAEIAGISASQAAASLEALEGQGLVLRGRFTPDLRPTYQQDMPQAVVNDAGISATADTQVTAPSTPPQTGRKAAAPLDALTAEWCHRRLLARIHRLTMDGLRRQIEPVPLSVFFRFLFQHHGFTVDSPRSGSNGVLETVTLLQGIDVPAVAWERDLLRPRVAQYRSEWLDELCLAGEVGWGRLYPPERTDEKKQRRNGLTRVVPVSLFRRRDSVWLLPAADEAPPTEQLGTLAEDARSLLREHGAMFAGDLAVDLRILPTQLAEVLGELVSRGIVTADGFQGLRALLQAKAAGRERQDRVSRKVQRSRVPLSGAGRWSLWRRKSIRQRGESPLIATSFSPTELTVVEAWAWLLLRRYGVVFRDLVPREPGAPRWYDLLQVYRKLEARGQVRGGRFVVGVAGEQFAIGDTVSRLRTLRDAGPANELVVISGVDPLNLVGVLTAHDRVPFKAGNRVALLDGEPVAALVAGEFKWLTKQTLPLVKRLDEGRTLRRCGLVPAPEGKGPKPATNAAGSGAVPKETPKPIDVGTAASGAANGSASRKRRTIQQRLFSQNRIPRPHP